MLNLKCRFLEESNPYWMKRELCEKRENLFVPGTK